LSSGFGIGRIRLALLTTGAAIRTIYLNDGNNLVQKIARLLGAISPDALNMDCRDVVLPAQPAEVAAVPEGTGFELRRSGYATGVSIVAA